MADKTWKQIIEEAKKADEGFKPIPDDQYDFVISKAEAIKTAKGKDMYKVQAKVVSGDHARRVVFHNFVVSLESAQAMSIFLRQMAILGLDEAYFAAEPAAAQVAADLVGKVFRGTVETKPGYNKVTKKEDDTDNPRNHIVNFHTPSAEARQAALSTPTSANPNPVASPTAGASAPAAPAPQASPPAPAPETVAAPEAPVAAPPAPPSSGVPIPPPPPPPSF